MKKNSFIEGSFIASISIIVTKLLGVLYVIPFYSIIGVYGGCLYSYAYNIYNLFLNISTCGIPTSISKIVSEYNALKMYSCKEKAFKYSKIIVFSISVICFFILFFFSKPVAYLIIGNLTDGTDINDVSLVIKSVSFCLLIIPFLSVSKGYLQGHKYITPTSISEIIEQIVRIAIIILGSFITIKILKMKVSIGVSASVLGAFFGGIIAYIYIKLKINKNKHVFKSIHKEKCNIPKKEIIYKIFKYSVPLIIVSISTNIYSMLDLTFTIKGLTMVGFDTMTSQIISSIISTWGPKICMIITAISMGLSISLVPSISEYSIKNSIKKVNKRLNKCIIVILIISLPLTILISILSSQIYTVFYGYNVYGGIILKYLAYASLLSSFHLVMNMIIQSMGKYKLVYFNTLIGFLVNALLDIPLIIIFNKLGFYPYYGVITATIIGYSLSISIILIYLKNRNQFKYISILKTLKKMVLPLSLMIIFVSSLLMLVKCDIYSKTSNFLLTALCMTIGSLIYGVIIYKNKLLNKLKK